MEHACSVYTRNSNFKPGVVIISSTIPLRGKTRVHGAYENVVH